MFSGGEVNIIIGWIITVIAAILGWSLGISQFHKNQRKDLQLKEDLLKKEIQLKIGDEIIKRLGTVREGLYKMERLIAELKMEEGNKGNPRWVKPDRQLYDIWTPIETEMANFNFYFEGREIILGCFLSTQRKFKKDQELLTDSVHALIEQYFYKYSTEVPLNAFEREALSQVEKEADENMKLMSDCLSEYTGEIQNNFMAQIFDYAISCGKK